ncbi:MAG: RNA pseudouridine synthase [Treponema sp.]|nr:RNA pseudouridine synthase [Treponema sp.]
MERILYQSNNCVVINKLKGEAVEGAKNEIVDLQKELKAFLKADFVEAVNRLDVPVTGCALFALNGTALEYLNSVFAGRGEIKTDKRYWAIVEKPSFKIAETSELTHWIEINSRNNKSFAHDKEKQNCKKSSLRYSVIGEGTNYLFLEIELLSGRHHQIRAQLAAVGLHIKGDLKYGSKRSEKNGGIRLHARSLSFPNPENKDEFINVTADPLVMDNLWLDFIQAVPSSASRK